MYLVPMTVWPQTISRSLPIRPPLPSPSPHQSARERRGQLPHRHPEWHRSRPRPECHPHLQLTWPAKPTTICSSLPAPRCRPGTPSTMRSAPAIRWWWATDIVGLHLDKSFNIEIIDVYDPPSGIVSLNVPGERTSRISTPSPQAVRAARCRKVGTSWRRVPPRTRTPPTVRTTVRAISVTPTATVARGPRSGRSVPWRSNALIPRFGAQFTNTGHPIHALQISGVGEQWRLGATGRGRQTGSTSS